MNFQKHNNIKKNKDYPSILNISINLRLNVALIDIFVLQMSADVNGMFVILQEPPIIWKMDFQFHKIEFFNFSPFLKCQRGINHVRKKRIIKDLILIKLFVFLWSLYWRPTRLKNLYSQINHKLQWYREVTYKNTTQHIHDK
jgi:hypothetical protein